jgi:hypothetical protein
MTEHGASVSEVCPFCGQPLRTPEARERARESEERFPADLDAESEQTAAQRAHDLRVQTRIF